MVFLELIFLFSPFSATKTKLLPPVMHDSESSCFLSKKKNTFFWNISSSYFLSYKPKVWYWNILLFSTIRIYCYRKHAWLSAFPLYNFIGELAVIHVTFKNFWCMVLRYHILHYLWYKQPPIFKLWNFCIGDRWF